MGEMMNKKVLILFLLVGIFLVPVKIFALDLEKKDVLEIKSSQVEVGGYFLPNFDDNGNRIGTTLTNISGDEDKDIYYVVSANYNFFKQNVSFNYDSISKFLLIADAVSKKKNPNVKGASDVLFTLYDSGGNVIKEFLYGGNGDDYPGLDMATFSYDEEKNIDGYIWVIYSDSTDLEGIKPGIVLVKYDLNGNLVWQKNVDDSFWMSTDFNLGIYFYCDNNSIQMENDSTNEVIWKVDTDFLAKHVLISRDSNGITDGVIVLGSTGGSRLEAKAVIAKYDLKGNEVFKSIQESVEYYDVINNKNIENCYDGYIVIGNEWTSDTTSVATITKYDYNGKVVWEDKHSDSDYATVFSKITYNYDSTGRYNGYLILSYDITCPITPSGKIKLRADSQLLKKKKSIVRKLKTTSSEDCIKFDYVTYAYPSYEIVKDNNENGDITISNDKAYPGEVVRISATPKEGYSLKRIVVIDESGKEIEVRDDGTFIMPEGKVTVTALYNRISNPETVSACYVVLGIILAISIGTLIVTRKKENV